MGRNAVLGASVTACFIALSGCSANHYVKRGADLYSAGRFVEADEVFERSEPRLARAPLEQRAAYATYRGATFMALGDLRHAQHWLSMATQIEHEHPGTLPPSQRAFLDGAWRVLADRLPPTPLPATTAIASSNQVPSPSVESVPPSPAVQQRSLVP
jgi:hypothetical protein